jgi:chemotaxis protein histidine kinase CheA
MQSLSIIGHPGGRHAAAQQLLAQSPIQVVRCTDLHHPQTLQTALTDSGHTLLVYCPPGLALARALEQNSQTDGSQALQSWSNNARALLRHFLLNREHCTLINELTLLHTPNQALAALANKTGQTTTADTAPVAEQEPQPLLEALGTSLAYTDQQSANLYRDLESVADLNSQVALQQHQANLQQALQRITAEHQTLQAGAEQSHEVTQQLQQENALLQQQLHQIQQELEHTSNEYKKLTEAANAPTPATGAGQAPNQELQEENELLLLQLHQVQEELEHYFCEYQKLTQAGHTTAQSAPPTASQPVGLPLETLFDLKTEQIIGNNWFDAEHDGRWAGPGTTSTLTLPAVGQGRFELIFDIVHALDPHIVKGMQVQLNGEPLSLKPRFGKLPFRRFPCRVSAQIDTTGATQNTWQLQLRFPKTASPADKGSNDMRQLTIRLKTIRVRALAAPQQD